MRITLITMSYDLGGYVSPDYRAAVSQDPISGAVPGTEFQIPPDECEIYTSSDDD